MRGPPAAAPGSQVGDQVLELRRFRQTQVFLLHPDTLQFRSRIFQDAATILLVHLDAHLQHLAERGDSVVVM